MFVDWPCYTANRSNICSSLSNSYKLGCFHCYLYSNGGEGRFQYMNFSKLNNEQSNSYPLRKRNQTSFKKGENN